MDAQGKTGPLANSRKEGKGESVGSLKVRAGVVLGTEGMASLRGMPASRARIWRMRVVCAPAEMPPREMESGVMLREGASLWAHFRAAMESWKHFPQMVSGTYFFFCH